MKAPVLAVMLLAGAGCVATIGTTDRPDKGGGSTPGVSDPGTPTRPGAGTPPAGVPTDPAAASSGPGRLRRLTRAQFENTLRDLLGNPALAVATGDLDPDDTRDGFASIGATYAAISPTGVEQYETVVRSALDGIFADPARRAAFLGCAPAGVADQACARTFINGFGRRAWRRPLTTAEVDRHTRIAMTVGTSFNDPGQGLLHVALSLLTSPNFLYRVELGEPVPGKSGQFRYSPWEMASRLSYLFWNTTPDADLLAAAESGALGTPAGVKTQVTRLLASERARGGISAFGSELFDLPSAAAVPKDDPRATPALRAAMQLEVKRLFESRMDPGADLLSLFDTTDTFVNADLAALYGLTGVTGSDLVATALPAAGPRAGLLGTAAFLTIHSKDAATSPTSRGVFVNENILCRVIPAAPDNVDTTIKDPPPGMVLTTRERLEGHRSNPQCAACHAQFDPIGYAFEAFDWVGAARDKDQGKPVDTSGNLDGKPFKDARELAGLLRQLPDTRTCLVRNFFRYSAGHVETPANEADIKAWDAVMSGSGNKLTSFLAEIAASDAFRLVSATP
jgi:hypothetical protein